ncbi:hypothetical protein KI659_04130 [Litoribacter alkaliphilus]|uniref:Peptide O-xylosyltransferase n=1 Tax=Litoribacter ruber TaxID=702568 RepID=A0AAP2CIH8_9BACT|nr:beta-1,6-N-acetylglucosaminyltransferase [Litoribacter alkaliphilus]MBS9523200.1 hypothetical protein [Litoribacter alkaliphilus]
MKIVYLILAHRYPDQLIRLVNKLNTEDTHFLIHLDKKVGRYEYHYIHNALASNGNVDFLKRHTCNWAGFGIMKATYEGIKFCVENNIACDYLCLMSGQDYPIKSNGFIFDYLKAHEGKSFINFNSLPNPIWTNHNGGLERLTNWYIITDKQRYGFPNNLFSSRPRLSKLFKNTIGKVIPKRKFPSGFKPYGGAQFWTLHSKHVRYVYDIIQSHPDFFNFFKYVMVSDEFLFQTIMGNYPQQAELINTTLHFLEWDRPGAVLNYKDRENLRTTEHLFARKFDCNVDAEIIDYLDSHLL